MLTNDFDIILAHGIIIFVEKRLLHHLIKIGLFMIGAGIILINKQSKTLLLLRDDRIDIPYPNMWDIPGGKVEIGETPEQAIRREMNEELGISDLGEISLFKIITSEKITDYIFWKRLNINTNEIVLNEGQRIEYFDLDKIKKTELAFNYNYVLEEFYLQILKQ